jgi:hypothetical protein
MTPDSTAWACSTPIDLAVLLDYWLALLPSAEAEVVEEHLFACDTCGECLREAIALAGELRFLAQSGALRVIVGEELVQRAVETGKRVRQYEFAPGQTVACTIAADDDLLLARLAADLSAATRVDISFSDLHGVERHRMTDIPIRADAGLVIFHESAVFGKLAPTSSMVARLLAIDQEGDERLLGEYRFEHTRTIPGPPGWEW